MTDTIIVKDDESKEPETVAEKTVAEKIEDTATVIAEAASDQANETLTIAAQISAMMDSARASAESYSAQFAAIAESFNHLNEKIDSALVKLDSIFELQKIDVEEENDDEPPEVVVAEVKKPDTEELIETTETTEEVPEPRSKTKRRFI